MKESSYHTVIERAEVTLESGQEGGRTHWVRHMDTPAGLASSHVFIQTRDIEIYLVLFLMPGNGAQYIVKST